MQRRELSFLTYDDLVAEIERLERVGYRKLGQWNLGQICEHLSYYFRGSLEGFPFKLPWLVRKLLGRPMLRRLLKTGHMATGGRTIPASVPAADVNEEAAINEARELLGRLKGPTSQLHPSPLFDQLTADQWRRLHLIHAAHHLGFLIPNDS